MDSQILSDGRIWCPLCEQHIRPITITAAARLTTVNKRTIYRYIEAGEIYAVKIAGHCLIKPVSESFFYRLKKV